MKKFKKISVLLTTLVLFTTTSCNNLSTTSSSSSSSLTTNTTTTTTSTTTTTTSENKVKIIFNEENPLKIEVDSTYFLNIEVKNSDLKPILSSSNEEVVQIINNDTYLIKTLKIGSATISAKIGDVISSIEINVVEAVINNFEISFSNNEKEFKVNSFIPLQVKIDPEDLISSVKINVLEGEDLISTEGSEIYANKSGKVTIQAECKGNYSNILTFNLYDFDIVLSSESVEVNKYTRVKIKDTLNNYKFTYHIDDPDIIKFDNDPTSYNKILIGMKVGSTSFYFENEEGLISNTLKISVVEGNPYINIDKDEFYSNYQRASGYQDAIYRSQEYLMSGSIIVPDEAPIIEENRPTAYGLLIKNSGEYYSNNNKTYTVYNFEGKKQFDVYYGGAYITLEEVAAYIYAFGDVPVNYWANPDTRPHPSESPWGKYLRLNNQYFSGDINEYPTEPALPNITGNGGNLNYYEVDIGTTGTTCSSDYEPEIYNDGIHSITRGAARIVYSRSYYNGNPITDLEDRYVFYTYNHYNDFQEYLNYYNGWGEMFGNVTAGNEYGEVNPYNPPSDYVPVSRVKLF